MRPLSLLAALSALLLNSCYPPGDGKPPPLEQLYFPTGLALDGLSKSAQPQNDEGDYAPKYMYVVNSDFDLQYRAGSVISYDLDRLHELLPRNCNTTADCQGDDICDAPGVEGIPADPARVPSYFCVNPRTTAPCGAFGDRDEADLVLYPGRCKSIDPVDPQDGSATTVVDAVGIGAFATDALWRANPEAAPMSPSRLFIPVRGDSTLHWIDLKDGEFSCGQNESEDGNCNTQHRSGFNPSDNADNLRQPSEPYAIDATSDGKLVGLTNQTTGSVSLYDNDWASSGGPKLVSILANLPVSPVGIAALPDVVTAEGVQPSTGFLVAYRTAAQIDLLKVFSAEPHLGYTDTVLAKSASAPIMTNSLGYDSRGIVIDDAQRKEDYKTCQDAAGDCTVAADPAQCSADLTRCLRSVHQPAVYVASRAPASLLVGAMTANPGSPSGSNDLPSFTDSIQLTFGPSRVIVGNIKVKGTKYHDDAGPYDLERRVFVVCFDSRRIFVYNPKRRGRDTIVSTGRGPYALAVDELRGLLYLGHFTDSYLGVVSLDQRFPQTYATIVASIGAPKAPRSSK